MKISVIVPVYGCRAALRTLYERVVSSVSKIADDFELILVNDRCPQNSWEVIKELCAEDKRVVGINLARNFGQIKAITAGLDYCSGDWVVVMDCDLQDRPEEIIRLYKKAVDEDYDVVFAKRRQRKDSALKKVMSRAFYKVYNYFSDGCYDPDICNFSISKKKVIENYCRMREENRGFVIFMMWLGFRRTSIDVEHDERFEGRSSYGLKKRFKLASEIILSQSNKPLLFTVKLGVAISLASLIAIICLVINYFVTKQVLTGWTSLIVSIYLIGGLLMVNIGVVGIYVGSIFNESKRRPLYVTDEILNGNDKQDQ
jgi:glycosyltransferase involved in cell wall biosynthesis